jgi:hypothetical protein
MSDMRQELTTFTVRELSRETAHVLEVCAREGAVTILSRDGRSFVVSAPEKVSARRAARSKTKPAAKSLHPVAQAWADQRARMRAQRERLGLLPLNREQMEALGRMIAGE